VLRHRPWHLFASELSTNGFPFVPFFGRMCPFQYQDVYGQRMNRKRTPSLHKELVWPLCPVIFENKKKVFFRQSGENWFCLPSLDLEANLFLDTKRNFFLVNKIALPPVVLKMGQ
jgi:hypothetical protein